MAHCSNANIYTTAIRSMIVTPTRVTTGYCLLQNRIQSRNMTRNITLKIQLKFCGTSGSQALMHLSACVLDTLSVLLVSLIPTTLPGYKASY